MTTRSRSLLPAALLAVGACSFGCSVADGGQTGNDGDNGGECDEVKTPLETSEVSELGFSAADVLAYVEAPHAVSFEWLPAMAVPYGPEQGSSELQVDVQSLGRVRFVERTVHEDGPMSLEAGDCCPESLELDVRVTLRSSGGALDETFDAVVDATKRDRAELTVLLEPPLGGTLWFDRDALGSARLLDLQLDLHFEPEALSGRLFARFQNVASGQGLDGSVSLTIEPLAEWGPRGAPLLCGE